MSARFDHTIVPVRDKAVAARFWAEMLELPAAVADGPFLQLTTDNGAVLAFLEVQGEFARSHYAFGVDDAEFDALVERLRQRGLAYWADPFRKQPAATYLEDGRRGVYWEDPDGHYLEALTPRGAS